MLHVGFVGIMGVIFFFGIFLAEIFGRFHIENRDWLIFIVGFCEKRGRQKYVANAIGGGLSLTKLPWNLLGLAELLEKVEGLVRWVHFL